MKNISAGMLAHVAGEVSTLCTCWKITQRAEVGGAVFGFTDHDQDIVISGWSAPNDVLNGTYQAETGYTASDIAASSDLNVDNLTLTGMLSSPSIDEADLAAGLWDNAAYSIFMVNWQDLSNTMGPIRQRDGWLGQVTLDRNQWKADLDGMMKMYARTIGQIDAPMCNANLGDTRCLQNMTTFTKTGSIASVSADGMTLYDPARTEAGPTGGVAITGITRANPGVVTLAAVPSPLFTNLQLVTISGVVGMTNVNAVTVIRNPSGATFQLSVDTTAFPAYVSGGTATPFGTSGYFDFGVITMTSGLNNGRSMEIKSYVPGQFTLYLPLPYTVAPGDTYSVKAGCDKSMQTCRDRFANLVHFRGSPYVPGLDKIVQVGRH